MTTSTLTRKGQATIPKDVRDHLGIKPGDRVEFVTTPMGQVVLLPKTATIQSLKGILAKPERAATQAEIDAAGKPPRNP